MSKVQRLVERRKIQVNLKWETSQVDEDIVWSLYKYKAELKLGQYLTNIGEHKRQVKLKYLLSMQIKKIQIISCNKVTLN